MYCTWEPTNNISEKKFEVDSPRPDLGLNFGGISGKLNVYYAAQTLFLKIEG